jgi:hypothetical protein
MGAAAAREERRPAASPVLPLARLGGEAAGVRLVHEPLQPVMGRLSMFFVMHRGASSLK